MKSTSFERTMKKTLCPFENKNVHVPKMQHNTSKIL